MVSALSSCATRSTSSRPEDNIGAVDNANEEPVLPRDLMRIVYSYMWISDCVQLVENEGLYGRIHASSLQECPWYLEQRKSVGGMVAWIIYDKNLDNREREDSQRIRLECAEIFPENPWIQQVIVEYLADRPLTALYPNNLKNREFGQEAPQIFCPARPAVFEDTVGARDEKCGGKPTPPKTDSSGCLGISNILGISSISLEVFEFYELNNATP
jgi:hypothetical protein